MKHARFVATLSAVLAMPLAQAAPIELKVMTRNIYGIGADLAPIFAAPPSALPFEIADAILAVGASKPEERMQRIAQEIFDAKPHIVGLQEAVLWRSQTPSDFVPPALGDPLPPPNAASPLFGGHMSDQIVAALAGLGMSYKIYARQQNGDNELPGFNPVSPNFLTDYRLTDHDAILVRDDLPASELKVLGEGGIPQYAATLTLPIGGSPVEFPTSYGFVDVAISGIPIRVFNTHLEPIVGAVNELQGLELIGAANVSPYRQILLGDFNTVTNTGPTLTDENILGAGFSDAWLDNGTGPGFTYGHDAALSDPAVPLTERLDYVFHRGGFNTLDVDIVGTTPFDFGGDGPPLWPSDHAGVIAVLQVVPEPGTIVLVLIALGGLAVTRRR